MFKLKKITESIYHFEFKRKCDLFLSMMRCQEFFECQHEKIKGKKFTLEDLIVAYSEMDKSGEFNYFDEWAAFNFPDTTVKEFIKVMGNNLLDRERRVLTEIKKTLQYSDKTPTAKLYYIGTYILHNENPERDFRHELAHGLFNTSSMYNKMMLMLLDNQKQLVKAMSERLVEMLYTKEVLLDEIQSYLATGSLHELHSFGFDYVTEKDVYPFRRVFNQFTPTTKLKRKVMYVKKETPNANQSRIRKQ